MVDRNMSLIDAMLDRLMERVGLTVPAMPVREARSVRVADIIEEPKGAHVDMLEHAARPKATRERAATTGYKVQYTGKAEPVLFNTAAIVWNAAVKLTKGGKTVTEKQLVTATGRKVKTVQSAIWYLRNHDAKGNRIDSSLVKAGKARAAMLVSVAE